MLEGQFFRGNPLLKRARTNVDWTPELIQEYKRCKDDIEYFAEKYVKIIDKKRGFVPIQLYEYQREIIQKYQVTRNLIITQARQSGKTTCVTVIILHFILFNEYQLVALLANKEATAIEILDRIARAYEALPDWLQMGVTSWNAKSIELENHCKVVAAATSSTAIRGLSVDFLYLDEAAHIDKFQNFLASVLPTLAASEKSKLVMTSTPNGLNVFGSIWEGAKKGPNGYAYVEVPWTRVPGRDEAWRLETLGTLNFDEELFQQEHCCSFIGSSGTLISGAKLKQLEPAVPIKTSDGLSMYVAPVKEHTYAITVDVSRGKGLDYSAFQVIDVTSMPYKQVCVYKNNMVTPIDYSSTVYRIAKAYNEAIVLVEINDIGGQVADSLAYDYEYENIIYTENAGSRGKRMSIGGSRAERGVRTTTTVKSVGCSMLKLLIEQNQLDIVDANTIFELSRFSRKGKSYEAESGANDDLVMGLVLFAWMTEQQYFKEMTNIETLSLLRDISDEQLAESLVPFGFSSDEYEDSMAAIIDLNVTPGHSVFKFF